MFSAAAPAGPGGPGRCPSAPIASRWPRPSGRKNAYRGLAACRGLASGQPCSQALIASGKTRRSPTTARRSHLLQQSNPISPATLPTVTVTATTVPYDAAQTSGSGLGGIFGGNYGVDVGGALGSSFGPVGTGVGAVVGGVIGGLGGSYVGGATAGYLYNNFGAVGNAVNTWGRNFTPYGF